MRQAIKGSAAPTIAVSPIVDGSAIKGPTAKLMTELGVPVSPTAVVQHYGDLLDGFILDEADAGLASSIETSGIACAVTGTVMRTLEDRTAAGSGRSRLRPHFASDEAVNRDVSVTLFG